MHTATFFGLFGLSFGYTLVKDYPDTKLSGRITLTNGTSIAISYSGASALYSEDGEFNDEQKPFLCLFPGDEGYHEHIETDCVAARFEKGQPCEDTIIYGTGKSLEAAGYCWMADTIMACPISDPIGTFVNKLEGHEKEIARCFYKKWKTVTTTAKPEPTKAPQPPPIEPTKKPEPPPEPPEEPETEEPEEPEEETEEPDITTTKTPRVVPKGPKKPEDTKEDDDEKLLEKGKVMWNETARLLTIIGTAASVLLFLQVLVLAMSIKLIKRQAYR
ncbi:unnamed protein product [Cylicocyclus nassatus]|uniref:Uncharacterized protein n=1 Tax=Cylicocyclus nassatus TaxID=53992 RepID=A0AA36GT17_CYLNA|nr:unnamed protein product [Cylicocyclus nassatus]